MSDSTLNDQAGQGSTNSADGQHDGAGAGGGGTPTTPTPASNGATTSGTPADGTPGGGSNADGKGADADGAGKDGADGKAKDDPAKAGAPEAYVDFTVPEGVSLDTEVLDGLKAAAKEANLPQAAAQKFVDLGVKLQQKFDADLTAKTAEARAAWKAEATKDPEIGGDKLEQSKSLATAAVKAFGNDKLTALLDQSGLGDHPEVVRFLASIGRGMSEDRVVSARGTTATSQPTAKDIYSASEMNP